MTDIYIGEPVEIRGLGLFTDEFARNHELDNITTYNDVFEKWRAFVSDPNAPTQENMDLPDTHFQRGIFRSLDHPGVYGIFARWPRGHRKCFYVGMSSETTTTVHGRIQRHLHGDIAENYGEVFQYLGDAREIFLCSAVLPNSNLSETIKEQLRLLESCLTVGLRPRFLTRLAGNAR